MTPQEFFEYAKKMNSKMLDVKFVDMLGTWQHCTFSIAPEVMDEQDFETGFGFDGSSIRGWQDIHKSDMMAVPDLSTVCMDPFFALPTITIIADIVDPITRGRYSRDPRYIAQKGAQYIKDTGIADSMFIGPEPEFFIFDEVRFEQKQNKSMHEIDSVEGAWNTARFEEPNLGYKPSFKGGYFPVSPSDTLFNIRSEMVIEMQNVGIAIEKHHHEVATAGQAEIDMKYAELTKMCDQFMWYKYICKNVAKKHGKTVTFMPKPIFEDNGSGMHTHVSLWKDGNSLFAGDQYAGLSNMALYAAGGLLTHAAAILAFAAPTANSYHRLVPGFEAPVNLAISARNRSASIRIPMYTNSPKAKRLEFRCPDPSANGYLAWSAMLMAIIDGIKKKLDPGEPLEVDIYHMSQEESEKIPKVPSSLAESLNALESDQEFLKAGGVFTSDLIEGWIDYKHKYEIDPLRLRPHPYEFHLYYDC
ncbi:MAG TPA: type I glutamate--ammonia ligase [Candidatus Deferrimicrobium sp.]|nr:type I glutamate--ammonia ligase [Candidatus Deferrimicrobium sp.]